ncbi:MULTISPECIES: helix-turn-helix transcriptional regulator [Brevibacillus]|uniref:helix-turn-helix domain-containing protein n=1 Tax=Brevibacillus TaxID=55080 RepID=UPI00203EEA89|nr:MULTISPECIES: helix-turn-helix transcriptional regulator [Brevibacillus]MCM3078526.1 helix-turn-helix domain-containing protein [Brevibacillus invocatus]MCM3430896.1 helix-turn-helix domain-containing protein [Brevibacillus invocatus]MDH4619472.1 helix-turn-helix transcriptional regulator [Brevibacillus sp. AY1]
MTVNTLGERVKMVRKRNKLTQVDFAKILGISQSNLSEIESGKSKPSIDVLISLITQFEIDLQWLLLSEVTSCKTEIAKDEMELISSYRKLQDIAKEEVLDFVNLKLARYRRK